MSIFKNKKKVMAKKMATHDSYSLRDLINPKKAPPKGMGIYDRGERDYSNETGHGLYKNQGLTKYIDTLLRAEKAGVFPHNEHLK